MKARQRLKEDQDKGIEVIDKLKASKNLPLIYVINMMLYVSERVFLRFAKKKLKREIMR